MILDEKNDMGVIKLNMKIINIFIMTFILLLSKNDNNTTKSHQSDDQSHSFWSDLEKQNGINEN